MASQAHPSLTPAEYLAYERRAEFKSEYFDGDVVAMVGASRKHNLIGINIGRELSDQLRTRPCEVYGSDMRVKVPAAQVYTYPDVSVACNGPEFEDEVLDTLLNPTVIIEILSQSTESYDRGKKFALYRSIPALAEYLLVAQDEYRVEQYVKQPDGNWLLLDHDSLDDGVELRSLGCVLTLAEVYHKVVLE
ncbi:MAG TPA: Uma2 family endonuclease [Ardenticatenaceae bacterium]|nr:Uma2 family endonuclease [Ardenticatenaceae bacterium]